MQRDAFLRIVAVAGSGLALGVTTQATLSPTAFLRLGDDGLATVVVNKAEMGQGVATSLPMLVAEELDLPLERVRYELAPAEERYYDPTSHSMTTGGSTSIRNMAEPLRKTGATARAMLVAAAAQTWHVDAKACRTAAGVVIGPSGQRAPYGSLVALAATLPVPTDVRLKSPSEFVLLGTRPRRLDVVGKTNGTAAYGLDVRVPGMKYASVEKPREIGATVASVDASDALKVPGVRRVVPISSGVAVIADSTWSAFEGRKALRVSWKPGPNAGVSTASVYAAARTAVTTMGAVVKKTGDAPAALAAGTPIVATYEIPYAAHAPMEPMNATADVRADRVTVWAPTQSPVPAQQAAMKASGLPQSAVVVQMTMLGGGFGRRLSQDYVTDAVEISKAAGMPIQVVWTREDDIRNDPYRPGSVNALQATLAPDGTIAAYRHTLAVQSAGAMRPGGLPNGVDASWLRGTGDFAYAIPNVLVDGHLIDVRIPVGPWRAPAANANTFATESFVDELAHAAGKDPVAFRLAMLERGSRARNVLEIVAERSGWGKPVPAGRARGVALATWSESWVAVVAEVSMPARDQVKVERMWAAVDCGLPINRDGIETQLTSGMLYGLSATLRGKITFENGVVQQGNFRDYPVLRMNDAPAFDVQIVASTAKPTGAGEIGTPPVPPAVANALFALSGQRVRRLPLLENLT